MLRGVRKSRQGRSFRTRCDCRIGECKERESLRQTIGSPAGGTRGSSGVVGGEGTLGELAEIPEAFVATGGEGLGLDPTEFIELLDDPLPEVLGGFLRVAVGSAEGLLDDGVDDAEALVFSSSEVEGLGGGVVVLLVGLFPEDRRAALGADDGVPGVFEHGDAICDGDAEGSAGAALADDDAHDGGLEACHFAEIDCDGLGLASLLGTDAGVGARGVNESDDGESKLGGELHFEECLAVALGVCAAEVAGEFFLRVAPLVMADDEALDGADASESGDDGGVFAEASIAVEFTEVLADHGDVVAGLRSSGVAGDADGVPRGEAGVETAEELGVLLAECGGVLLGGEVVGALAALERLDLGFESVQWFLEIECVDECHGFRKGSVSGCRGTQSRGMWV